MARVEGRLALALWRERRGGSPQERIAAAYAQLEAQGLRPTNKRIVQLTQVDVKAIAAYRLAGCPTLEQCRQAAKNKPPRAARETPQERLNRALAQLEAQASKSPRHVWNSWRRWLPRPPGPTCVPIALAR